MRGADLLILPCHPPFTVGPENSQTQTMVEIEKIKGGVTVYYSRPLEVALPQTCMGYFVQNPVVISSFSFTEHPLSTTPNSCHWQPVL